MADRQVTGRHGMIAMRVHEYCTEIRASACIVRNDGLTPSCTSRSRISRVGSGAQKWGAVPMPAQSQLFESDARAVVEWILAGAK
jgi:hypothetical protein